MMATWGVWVALVVLVLSHVLMFALGAASYHCIRWINMRPMMAQRPQINEAKLAQIADKVARQQATAAQFSYMDQMAKMGRPAEVEQVEESFAPSKK